MRSQKTEKRTKFYSLNNSLIKQISNSYLLRYAMGSSISCIHGKYCEGLESVSSVLRDPLNKVYEEYASLLKAEEEKKFN